MTYLVQVWIRCEECPAMQDMMLPLDHLVYRRTMEDLPPGWSHYRAPLKSKSRVLLGECHSATALCPAHGRRCQHTPLTAPTPEVAT